MKISPIRLLGLIFPMAVFAQNPDVPIPAELLSSPKIDIPTVTYRTGAQTNSLQTTVAIGTRDHYSAGLSSFGNTVGGFVEGEEAHRINYDANDLERYSAGAFSRFSHHDWQIDFMASAEKKEYGAQGCYGIPSDVYAEEQTEDLMLLGSAFKGDLDNSFIQSGAGLRRFNQDYRLGGFSSATDSALASLFAEGRTLEIQNMALYLRGDLEHERVSGDLGGHRRTRGSILLLPEARFERTTIRAGLTSVLLSGRSDEWLPQAGIDFYATDNTRLFARYSETVQQPDFQLLYYSDPYHAGNSALQLQHTGNAELGLHQYLSAELDWQAAVFHRRIKNASDWTTTAADTAWTATDLGTLDAAGLNAELNYAATAGLEFRLAYQWIKKDDGNVYAGLYELDYPEHLLTCSATWQATSEIRLFGSQALRRQSENAVRSGNDFGAEASMGLHYDPRFAQNVRLSFRVDNLWDTDFQPIPGLKPRGRTASAGITVNW